MRHHWLRMSWMAVLWFSMAACGAAQQFFQDDTKSAAPLEDKSGAGEDQRPGLLHSAKASSYFIGVECRPVPDALRVHLNLQEGEGLLVEQVLPGSPGARAGILRYDVLLGAGDQTLKTVADLVAAIDSVGGKKLYLQVIRAGKSVAINVTPAKRPENMQMPAVPFTDPAEWDDMLRWLEKVRRGETGRPSMRFYFFQPGAILPPDAALPPLPGDVTIVVTRQGGHPTKIHVTRGDQKWDVGEKDLDKLPEELRPHVEKMLGRGGVGPWFNRIPPVSLPSGTPPANPTVAPTKPTSPTYEKRLEEMERRLEDFRHSIEQLRAKEAHQSERGS